MHLQSWLANSGSHPADNRPVRNCRGLRGTERGVQRFNSASMVLRRYFIAGVRQDVKMEKPWNVPGSRNEIR